MSKSILNLIDSGVEVKIALGREEIEKIGREMAAESKQVELQPKKQVKQVKEVIKEKTIQKTVKSAKPVKKVKRYYAVKEAGTVENEIYTDWSEVQCLLTGCVAVHKSFKTLKEAEAYLELDMDIRSQKSKILWCMNNKKKSKKKKKNKKQSKKSNNNIIINKSINNSEEPVLLYKYNAFEKNNVKIIGEMAKDFKLNEDDETEEEIELDVEMKEIFDRIDNLQFEGLFDKFK